MRIPDASARFLAGAAAFGVAGIEFWLFTRFGAGLLSDFAVVAVPIASMPVTWILVYRRTTRLRRCPSGCGRAVDMLAAICPGCGCPLQPTHT